MDLKTLLTELAPWHFDIELKDGLRTVEGNREAYDSRDHAGVGMVSPDEMRPLFRDLLGGDFGGRSFLDVGCNAGGYCFVAKDMGAGRVLGFDVRDHWIEQAKFVQKHGVTKDRDAIEFRVCHLRDLPVDDKFDVTLFKGVFYHLPDPIHDLLLLCDRTRELIIVDSATTSRAAEGALLSTWESTTHVMSGVDNLAWYPGGPKALKDILRYGGFPESETVYWRKENDAVRGHGRCRVVAARTAGALELYRASKLATA